MEGNMMWIDVFIMIMLGLGAAQFMANRRKQRK